MFGNYCCAQFSANYVQWIVRVDRKIVLSNCYHEIDWCHEPKFVLAFFDDDKGCFGPFDRSQDSNPNF